MIEFFIFLFLLYFLIQSIQVDLQYSFVLVKYFVWPLFVTIVSVLIELLNINKYKSVREKLDCPGWLCNIIIVLGLLLNNNSVAFSPGAKDTLS